MNRIVKMLAPVAVVLVLWQAGVQGECITITIGPVGDEAPPPPKPPIRVSGAFCGTAVVGADPLGGLDLEIINGDTGAIAGKVHVDSRGRFRLSKLPVGRYRVALTGFTTSEAVEITASGKACEQPLRVNMVVAGECNPASHIATVLPTSR